MLCTPSLERRKETLPRSSNTYKALKENIVESMPKKIYAVIDKTKHF